MAFVGRSGSGKTTLVNPIPRFYEIEEGSITIDNVDIRDLKNAEKRLKRGKISEDGLNFSRANLAISYLALQDKRGLGQAKRYLKPITSKSRRPLLASM